MNEEQASAQIAFNFGPVNGNVEKQEIHLDKPVDKGDKSDNVVGDKGDDVAGGRGVLSVKQLIILLWRCWTSRWMLPASTKVHWPSS